MFRRIIPVVFFAFVSDAWSSSAEISPRYSGVPLMRVFTERETGGTARNHAVAAHPSGLVYLANDVGLREFDGVTWRVIAGTERRMIFNVVVDGAGRVYYCGPNHFGRLGVAADGVLTAQPLQPLLPEADREVGDVRSIVALGDSVYFAPSARALVVRVDAAGGVHVIRLPGRVAEILPWAGVLYALVGEAVYRIDGDTVTLERSPPLGLNTDSGGKTLAALPHAEGGAVILARDGLRRWQTDSAPLVSDEVARLLGNDAAVSGCALGDGTFAFGTRAHGLLIVAGDGRVLARYGEDNGLGPGAGYVEGLKLDADGGLWVAHDGGVTRVEVRAPAALHGPVAGLRSRQIFALTLHRGRLHVGTSQGVSVRDAVSGRFTPLSGAPANVNALVSTEEGLIACGSRMVLFPDRGPVEVIDAAGQFSSALRLPRAPDRIVASTGAALRVYRRTGGTWQLEGAVRGVVDRLGSLVQDDAGWLWGLREPRRVVRLDWRQGVRLDAVLETMGEAQGLPVLTETQANGQLVLVGGVATLVGGGGGLRHDGATDRFGPDARIAGWAAGPVTQLLFPLGAEDLLVLRRGPPKLGLARPTDAGTWALAWEPFSGFESLGPRVALRDPTTNTLWLGGQQLASYDLGRPRVERTLPVARVRRVTTTDQKELWQDAGAPPPLVLPPEENGLTFSFAAAASVQTNVRGQSLVGYRTRLEGFDRDWSPWSLATMRTYTNLPPGAHVFRVQAATEDYRAGPEATWAFRLLPPWWRTWWFLGIAGVSGIGSVAGTTRWLANRALRRRLERLEAQSAVERERLRLARDLHDEVGSGLGRVILFAGEARRNKADAAKLDSALDRVRETAQELVQHAREIVWAVSPQHDTLASVSERLGDYAEETLRAAGITCRIETPATAALPAATLGSEARHSLFLAVKEAVHNCVKYSEAKSAEFRLQTTEDSLTLTLQDDGRGFAAGEIRGTGHGLVSIAARAEALGGRAEISSEPGKGTSVTVRVPLRKATANSP